MLDRLKPFRYVAVAVLALLVAAVLLATDKQQTRTEATPVAQAQPATQAPTSAPLHFRPEPKIGPATLIYKVETTDPVVFLTIDDGAHRDPAMAGILRDAGIRATFFLTDRYVEQDAEFFRKLRDDTGSVIENHTATHLSLKGKPLDRQVAEIVPVSDRYEQLFGTRPTLFRAPYGNSDDVTLQAAGEAGAKYVVNWGSEVRGGQVKFSGPREFRPGSIVLTHFTPTFAADVAAFLAQARANGLTPALLTDYLR